MLNVLYTFLILSYLSTFSLCETFVKNCERDHKIEFPLEVFSKKFKIFLFIASYILSPILIILWINEIIADTVNTDN